MTFGSEQYPGYATPTPHQAMPKIVTDLQQAIDQLRSEANSLVNDINQPHPAPSPAAARLVNPNFARQAEDICKGVFYMLCDKNASYGNSALDPIRVFSRADADEQIKVRIDDKLSRIKFGAEYPGDDTVLDTIGYLILLLIANQRKAAA